MYPRYPRTNETPEQQRARQDREEIRNARSIQASRHRSYGSARAYDIRTSEDDAKIIAASKLPKVSS